MRVASDRRLDSALKIFVSYSHQQSDWVRDRLIPVLRAGGLEVLFDERFRAARALVAEMDALQDQADRHVLVLSSDYLKSSPCKHEMNRAVALPPGVSHWSLTTLQASSSRSAQRSSVGNARYVTFQMAELAVLQRPFEALVRRIFGLLLRLPESE